MSLEICTQAPGLMPRRPFFALAFGALALLAVLPREACAGDGAALQVLGFSLDGRRFAFEETGNEDASTFPYFRVVAVGERPGQIGRTIEIETDPAKVPDLAREQARGEAVRTAEAAAARHRLDVESVGSGLRLARSEAARADEELLPLDIFPTMAEVASGLAVSHPALGGEARIELVERQPSSGVCESLQPDARKMRLVLRRAGQADVTLFDGPADLRAAGCPRRYGLVSVHLNERTGARALAVVFQSFPLGFEEPDRRFGATILSLENR